MFLLILLVDSVLTVIVTTVSRTVKMLDIDKGGRCGSGFGLDGNCYE